MKESFPTPYADVNAVLKYFTARSRFFLDRQFVGFYLYGSLALGDFNPDTSDIDWIVVTQGENSARLVDNLREMHAHFDQSHSPWAGRVEAAYIPQNALNHNAATSAAYPQVEKGTGLFLAPLESGWAFQRYILREHGIAVAGPDIRSLIDPVERSEMVRAAAVITEKWLEQSRQDPSWIAWVRQRDALSFVVLSLCRLLYSLATGSVASKPAAARWAQVNLDGRWRVLVQRSLVGQHDRQEIQQPDLEEMLALLAYTSELSQHG